MIFKCFSVGMLGSNSYIVGSGKEGILIDAGVNSNYVNDYIEKNGLIIKYILLTHTHIDHIYHLDELKNLTGALVVAHEEDAAGLIDEAYNCSNMFGAGKIFRKADMLVKEGDLLDAGDLKIGIIHTPGHTKGSICIKSGKMLFTGDTLFKMSVGRTDFEGGSRDELESSILNKLMTLEDDVVIYPGHGAPSTIGYEREHNPFIKFDYWY